MQIMLQFWPVSVCINKLALTSFKVDLNDLLILPKHQGHTTLSFSFMFHQLNLVVYLTLP